MSDRCSIFRDCAWCSRPASGIVVSDGERTPECIRCAAVAKGLPLTLGERMSRADKLLRATRRGGLLKRAKLLGVAPTALLSRVEERGYSGAARPRKRGWKKRDTTPLTHAGITDTIEGWSKRTGFTRNTIRSRICRGMSVSRALTLPLRTGNMPPALDASQLADVARQRLAGRSVPKIAADLGVTPSLISRVLAGEYAPALRVANTRIKLTIGGRTQTLIEWAEEAKLSPHRIRQRLYKGWTADAAVLTPSSPRTKGINS